MDQLNDGSIFGWIAEICFKLIGAMLGIMILMIVVTLLLVIFVSITSGI